MKTGPTKRAHFFGYIGCNKDFTNIEDIIAYRNF
ncbi:hypothetical protein DFR58_12619 [Anaerobacterium chartisolvens]|uniref:Uncharacterized protein n=1 Tax=Anaerobacterium chartisolvens TaxID=1297424 RepID=A0A369ASK5_9FIRM|nr:hypothetical protein DFR58_12619 [Anaerobacterium chartisolvens]